MQNSPVFTLDIEIDRKSPIPLHTQIAEPLARMIESGQLAPGTKLEDEVSMAERLQVSRPTARRALETLSNRGLIIRRRGAGTQVTPARVRRPMLLTSLNDDLVEAGRNPRTSVLGWTIEASTPGVAAALGIAEGTEVVYMRRLRMIGDEPLAILSNWVPTDIAPTREELAQEGLYARFRDRGVKIAVGVQQIGARLATADEARLLNEPQSSALLTMQRTAYDDRNRAVEFAQHVYRASMYSYDHAVFA